METIDVDKLIDAVEDAPTSGLAQLKLALQGSRNYAEMLSQLDYICQNMAKELVQRRKLITSALNLLELKYPNIKVEVNDDRIHPCLRLETPCPVLEGNEDMVDCHGCPHIMIRVDWESTHPRALPVPELP